VAGCDLRLSGTDLPPVMCLITRCRGGASIRKLIATYPISRNGEPISHAELSNGDRVTLGTIELAIQIESASGETPADTESREPPLTPVGISLVEIERPAPFVDRASTSGADLDGRRQELERLARHLDERQQQLDRQAQELTADRVIWYQRREEIEKEIEEAREALQEECSQAIQSSPLAQIPTKFVPTAAAATGAMPPPDGANPREEQLAAREKQLAREQQEFTTVRQEFVQIRQQLYDRYRERRDRLSALQAAVNHAARKVQENKRQVDAENQQLTRRREEENARQSTLDQQAAELASQQQELAEQRRRFAVREDALTRDVARERAELEESERALVEERETLRKAQAEYQIDLVRSDRQQASLELRRQQLDERENELNERLEKLQAASIELQGQVHDVEAFREKVRLEAEDADKRKTELERAASELAERAAALEGQQVTLASLRTRLERTREELERQQKQSLEQQSHLDAAEAELKLRIQEVQTLRAELDSEKQLREEERRRFEERQSELESAQAELHKSRQAVAEKEEELALNRSELLLKSESHAQETERLKAEFAGLVELQKRVALDREAIRERDTTLVQAEQVREALQEQLRRRSEELASRQRTLAEEERKVEGASAALEARLAEVENDLQAKEGVLAALRRQLDDRAAELDHTRNELNRREEQWIEKQNRFKQAGRKLGQARKSFLLDRARWRTDVETETAAVQQQRAELDSLRSETLSLVEQLPDLELRAQAAAERLAQSREEIREHLAELHSYAHQSQEDAEALRSQALLEAEEVRQQRLLVHRAREEHRLAVAAFRQQLIQWQGQVREMKRSLAHGETRLERRQAQVEEQARRIDATSVRLADQAGQLQEQERIVAESRKEMEGHLDDMRAWYRRKLRELSERRRNDGSSSTAAATVRQHAVDPSTSKVVEVPESSPVPTGVTGRDSVRILSFSDEIEPGDRTLGELLHSLKLVDSETLQHLLEEALRHHRSLRQALLAGGYLTVYQMALIETDNLDALVAGPVRVIDRLRSTPREAVYRVFDPRQKREAVLRHLAEAEMENAVHPDEFRQRFGQAAAVKHPNLAETIEVLEIAGRPAVLLEWLNGTPGSEWPAIVAVPGVWFRLLHQAALGLHAAHQAGIAHGHLLAESLILMPGGTLKISGLGEPDWMAPAAVVRSTSGDLAMDLTDLGAIMAAWGLPGPRRKGSKATAVDELSQSIVGRLTTESPEQRYSQVAALLEDLEKIKPRLPRNDEAWERLLQFVREHTSGEGEHRQSA
jgi:chromosome segregation ATPase